MYFLKTTKWCYFYAKILIYCLDLLSKMICPAALRLLLLSSDTDVAETHRYLIAQSSIGGNSLSHI